MRDVPNQLHRIANVLAHGLPPPLNPAAAVAGSASLAGVPSVGAAAALHVDEDEHALLTDPAGARLAAVDLAALRPAAAGLAAVGAAAVALTPLQPEPAPARGRRIMRPTDHCEICLVRGNAASKESDATA